MTNSNPSDLPCTFNFMGLVSSKIPSACLVLQAEQVERNAQKDMLMTV